MMAAGGVLAGLVLASAPETAHAQACNQDRQNRRPGLLEQGIGMLAGAATNAVSDQMGEWGVRPDYRFRSTLNRTLTDGIACMLNPAEREQAAAATNDAISQGVGSQVAWQSETRPGVSGTTAVLSENVQAGGGACVDVRDVVVGEGGRETVATKRMCRRPGQSGYQVVQGS